MQGAGTTARRFFFVMYVIYHTLSFQAPSSNQLMHDKNGRPHSYAATERLLLEYSKGAGMAPKQFKETIFPAVFLTNLPHLTSRLASDITHGPTAERST